MNKPTLHIAATGCCLMDYLYTRIDMNSSAFQEALSRRPGDGGLQPGALVFSEAFETYIKTPFPTWVKAFTEGREPDAENLGGPAIVALVHAAQMLHAESVKATFHAGYGEDDAGRRMLEIIGQTPVDLSAYQVLPGPSPSTVVLSDPSYHDGAGERSFINTIGAANAYTPDMLGDDFFGADIRLFGATALVPVIHDHLTELLQKGRESSGLNVVGTVYDFRNEERHPDRPWPLGNSAESFPCIDLLVCDHEEALKISGEKTVQAAVSRFLDGGVSSVVVTNGAKEIHLASQGGAFTPVAHTTLPVSSAVLSDLAEAVDHRGDTTGCGDNFLGGVLTSLALQMLKDRNQPIDLVDACAWGIASGGYACFYPGGTMLEDAPGIKRKHLEPYYWDCVKSLSK